MFAAKDKSGCLGEVTGLEGDSRELCSSPLEVGPVETSKQICLAFSPDLPAAVLQIGWHCLHVSGRMCWGIGHGVLERT